MRSGSTCGAKDLIQKVHETPPGASGVSTCRTRMATSYRLPGRFSILPSFTVLAWAKSPLIHFRIWRGCVMAFYKVRIEVWCDWNPAESDLDEIAQGMGVGEALCTRREVVAVVDRPQDIEDEDAMNFFGGSEGDADESQG